MPERHGKSIQETKEKASLDSTQQGTTLEESRATFLHPSK